MTRTWTRTAARAEANREHATDDAMDLKDDDNELRRKAEGTSKVASGSRAGTNVVRSTAISLILSTEAAASSRTTKR